MIGTGSLPDRYRIATFFHSDFIIILQCILSICHDCIAVVIDKWPNGFWTCSSCYSWIAHWASIGSTHMVLLDVKLDSKDSISVRCKVQMIFLTLRGARAWCRAKTIWVGLLYNWYTTAKSNHNLSYSWNLLTVQYFLPMAIISVAYARIAFQLWGGRPPGEAQEDRDHNILANKKKVSSKYIICNCIWDV